jgi:hypothetical protein
MRRGAGLAGAAVLLASSCTGHPGHPVGSSTSAPAPKTSPAADRAVLVGYRRVGTLSGTRRTSGAVSVSLSRSQAGRLAHLVTSLPKGRPPACIEPPILIYQIRFGNGPTLRHSTVVGFECAATVGIERSGAATRWRRDSSCGLAAEVRSLLPATARGTRGAAVGCR